MPTTFLQQCRHWVFDMDGTLTKAVHDFAYIRQQLEIPPTEDILAHLDALPAEQAAAKHRWLLEHELELAQNAQLAPGAKQLIAQLADSDCQLAILTRNAYQLALLTLQAVGLDDFFQPENILGREQAKPKPHPEGMLKIAQKWQVSPQRLTMVGDFHFDLRSAKAAGAKAILVNTEENLWPELTDFYSKNCKDLALQLAPRM